MVFGIFTQPIMTRRQLIAAVLSARLLRSQTIFGLGVDTRPKYVFSIGQSLALGGNGNPALTTSQPYTNQMFDGGTIMENQADYITPPPVASIASLVPMVEGVVAGGGHDAESHCSAFSNQIGAWARANGMGAYHDTVGNSWAKSGTAYSGLKKGTTPYNNSMAAVTRFKALLSAGIVPAILCIHGEADGSCGYYDKVVEWQSDYQTDIQAVTGQSSSIPMFISQVQAGECASGGFPSPPEPTYTGMLGSHELQYPLISLVCGKYIFPYVVGGTHLTNLGYRWLGEYYAKAYWKQIVLGQTWSPLRPSAVSTSGNVITIQFTGFVPPLVFDTTNVAAASDGNMGFTFSGTGGTLQSVAITNATTGIVQLTFDAPPTGGGLDVKYGFTGTPTGPTTGARGNLRDSDPLVSLNGNTLYNWCVMFSKKRIYP